MAALLTSLFTRGCTCDTVYLLVEGNEESMSFTKPRKNTPLLSHFEHLFDFFLAARRARDIPAFETPSIAAISVTLLPSA